MAALTSAAALLLAGCGSEGGEAADGAEPVVSTSATAKSARAATVLDQPFAKPDVTLTDTRGEKYHLAEETKKRPTLLYFGYTHCPDVCPLTMSNIAIAKSRLPQADQDRLRVVFITSDPERDTPERLRKWLRGQDPDFVGLTGSFDTIQKAARSVGVGIVEPAKDKKGNVVSAHGKSVLAFSPKDGKAHVIYGEEATVKDYTRDLPTLIKGKTPGTS
ncbi:SCO family protein [Streptomyces armeniacus]|uniref:SCO family protein n=2 Tax=Streptomyces armeniacus TaxID=83291 RepID=A0A345Y0P2_9ACTN|nr:SCO family protein [Streptomyces armeniacus]AXK37458.1 SCO family protein [Streptomyces armeniacus]